MFQEPHNTYTVGVRLYRPSRVDTHVAPRGVTGLNSDDPQRSCHVSVMTRRSSCGWRQHFKSVQRSNQFDHFSELGQREKSRRAICGIWSGVLTCDHLRKAVVQVICRGRGNCRYCLTYCGARITKVCRDLINSFSFLSEVNVKRRLLVCEVYGAAF